MLDYAIELALLATTIFAVSGVIQKRVADKVRDARTAIFVIGFGILPLLAMYLLYFNAMSTYALILAAISGIFFMGGDFLYFDSLEKEQVSKAYSIGIVQPLLIIAFSVAVLGEHITTLEAVAGAIMIFGLAFLDTEKRKLRIDRKLTPAILGNVSWAIYWMFLSSSIVSSGQIAAPIIVSRMVGFAAILLVFGVLKGRKTERIRRNTNIKHIVLLGAATGLLDGTGNGIWAVTVTLKSLSIASIAQLLGPFIVIAIAYFVYKERLSKVQAIGLLIAVAGAVILAIG